MNVTLTKKGIDKLLQIARNVDPLDIEHLHYLIALEDAKRELLVKQIENELLLHSKESNPLNAYYLIDEYDNVIGCRGWNRKEGGWITHVDK